jgi:glucan phosphoethanolaminetransferase (alkaline phosphatase superfamily)
VRDKFSGLTAFLVMPIFLLVLDIAWRWSFITVFTLEQAVLYLTSIIVLLITWGLYFQFSRWLFRRRQWHGKLFIVLAALFEIFVVVSSYGFYLYFNIIPNYYSLEYIVQEPMNSFYIFVGSLHWWDPLLVIGLLTLFIWYWLRLLRQRAEKKPGKLLLSFNTVLLLLGLGILNNNMRFQDQCILPDVNFVMTGARLAQNYLIFKQHIGNSGLQSATRSPLPKLEQKVPVNILILANESLRRTSLDWYGYPQATTPFLSNFLQQHQEEIFLFDRAYANSTTTMLSLTSMFTGISPVQPALILHKMPLIFDYAKAQGFNTFWISSQSFNWRNFDLFFATPSIDFIWNKEIGNAPQVNDWGTDDRYVVEEFANYLAGNSNNFVGILHTNTTHYPYFSDQPRDDFNLLVNYDNSIRYLDTIYRDVFGLLNQYNLLDNTIIIFTSDHGEAFGEHKYKGHVRTYYEEESAIPFWIYIPEKYHHLYRDHFPALRTNRTRNISNLDLVPTFLSLTKQDDIDPTYTQHYLGHSLLDTVAVDRPILMLNNNEVSNFRMFISIGLLHGEKKYIMIKQNSGYYEYLFDFMQDPAEQNNLITTDVAEVEFAYRQLSRHTATRILMEAGSTLGYQAFMRKQPAGRAAN